MVVFAPAAQLQLCHSLFCVSLIVPVSYDCQATMYHVRHFPLFCRVSRFATLLSVAVFAISGSLVLASDAAESRPVWQVLDQTPPEMMLRYFRNNASALSAQHRGPDSLSAWQQRQGELRSLLWKSLGSFPLDDRPGIRARLVGTIDHGDHFVEKIVYESLPGLYVTALVYVPKRLRGPAPAVICVNGHWPQSKHTPIIQRRAIMLARMGVIAFCQDVIGTGERAAFDGSEPVTYHGFFRGATPRIVDRSLLGYIMYECMRANDYLRNRPDVDPERIMCTGASGGGKQSMFFPALDPRLAGGAPVCYVSSYVEHMGATACVGEIPTGVLRFTDQWEILGLHGPRPLLLIAASRDVPVFQPEPMRQTMRKTQQRIYQLYKRQELVQLAEFDSPHDYNRQMRERFYVHVAEHLLNQPDMEVSEPDELPVEDEQALRCGLPAGSETMQSLTYRRARELASRHEYPASAAVWSTQRSDLLRDLEYDVLGGFPTRKGVRRTLVRKFEWDAMVVEQWSLETEPGVLVPAVLCLPGSLGEGQKVPAVVVVDQAGKLHAFARGLVEHLVQAGAAVLAIDYRGAGETAGTVPEIAYGPGTPEYNLSNYALLLGRPLMGMRAHDIRCAIDFLVERDEIDPGRLAVAGRGRGALAGALAAIVDERITVVIAEELLASWVFAEEFVDIGLSTLIPRILTVGDVEHLLACLAPRSLLLVNPVDGRNRRLDADAAARLGEFTAAVFNQVGATGRFATTVVDEPNAVNAIGEWLRNSQ